MTKDINNLKAQMNFKKILVLGSTGFVGENLKSKIDSKSKDLFLFPKRKELDLSNVRSIKEYLESNKPDFAINLAGKVGGIISNSTNNYNYLIDNLYININLINTLKNFGLKNFLNVSTSCIYPTNNNSKIKESKILSGSLEPTNEGYALAKISALKACEFISKSTQDYNYKTIIPCNIYGPFDNFDEQSSHMIPGVIKRIYDAKQKNKSNVSIWGNGKARREFMYVEDFIDFLLFCINNFSQLPQNLNVGLGYDYTILEYYKTISELIGYSGKFVNDMTKPSGIMRKLIDNSELVSFGWEPKYDLKAGLQKTIKYYENHRNEI